MVILSRPFRRLIPSYHRTTLIWFSSSTLSIFETYRSQSQLLPHLPLICLSVFEWETARPLVCARPPAGAAFVTREEQAPKRERRQHAATHTSEHVPRLPRLVEARIAEKGRRAVVHHGDQDHGVGVGGDGVCGCCGGVSTAG